MALIFGSIILDSVLLIFVLVLLLFNWFYRRNRWYWRTRNVPHIPQKNILSVACETFSIRRHFTYVDLDNYRKLSGAKVGGFFEMARPILLIRDPNLLKNILVKDFHHFANRRHVKEVVEDTIFAKALTSLRGEPWKKMRAVLSPTFTSGKLKGMMPLFSQSGQQLVNHCSSLTDKTGETELDVADSFERFTMDTIASTAFGMNCDSFLDKDSRFLKLGKSFQRLRWLTLIQFLLLTFMPFLSKVMTVSFMSKDAEKFFRGSIRSATRSREGQRRRNDFLQLLLEAAQNEKDKSEEEQAPLSGLLSEDGILAQSILFITAGFDTVSSLISFAAYELALNPQVQEKLVREILDATENHGGQINYEAIQEMEYMNMVIKETLRKYPPATRTERECSEDYVIPGSGLIIEKGVLVNISIYSLHHDEDFYPDPERFDPERFSSQENATRNPYVYLPFGHGPLNCIGMRFALLETKVALASLLAQFELSPCSKTQIPIVFDRLAGLLKGENGMWLTIRRRL